MLNLLTIYNTVTKLYDLLEISFIQTQVSKIIGNKGWRNKKETKSTFVSKLVIFKIILPYLFCLWSYDEWVLTLTHYRIRGRRNKVK